MRLPIVRVISRQLRPEHPERHCTDTLFGFKTRAILAHEHKNHSMETVCSFQLFLQG